MAKFTLAENIFNDVGNLEQSVGSYKADEVQLVSASVLEVFEPDRGTNVLISNPRLNDNNTSLTESLDNRKSLGTFTLNNRDFWENNKGDIVVDNPPYKVEGIVKTKEKIIKRLMELNKPFMLFLIVVCG